MRKTLAIGQCRGAGGGGNDSLELLSLAVILAGARVHAISKSLCQSLHIRRGACPSTINPTTPDAIVEIVQSEAAQMQHLLLALDAEACLDLAQGWRTPWHRIHLESVSVPRRWLLPGASHRRPTVWDILDFLSHITLQHCTRRAPCSVNDYLPP